MLDSVKEILTKEVDVKEFLEMEIELTKLKKLLATEIKLKEFLVQEIDLKSFLSNTYSNKNDAVKKQMAENNELEASADESALKQKELSSNQKQTATPTATVAAVTKVKRDLPAYDFTLIDELTAEHKNIRFIFNQIMSFTISKDYEKVAGQLDIFGMAVRKHYQKSDIELYAYLKTYVQIKYPTREKSFTQLSLEMKNLSIEIFYIISQSPNIPAREETHAGFIKEFMSLGKLLNERINKEQNLLFKMYEQTNAAKSIS